MKTQIKDLRSGTKNQIKNQNVDYSTCPPASSHVGHSGTNAEIVNEVWSNVISENKDKLTIEIFGKELNLKAHRSLSGKSTSYYCDLDKEFFEQNFKMKAAKNEQPYLQISNANHIVAHNGKKSFANVCPSFITIK